MNGRIRRHAMVVGAMAVASAQSLVIDDAIAQPSNSGMMDACNCPMRGMGGMWMMAGAGLLTIAAIAALVALTIFLIRRSRA